MSLDKALAIADHCGGGIWYSGSGEDCFFIIKLIERPFLVYWWSHKWSQESNISSIDLCENVSEDLVEFLLLEDLRIRGSYIMDTMDRNVCEESCVKIRFQHDPDRRWPCRYRTHSISILENIEAAVTVRQCESAHGRAKGKSEDSAMPTVLRDIRLV